MTTTSVKNSDLKGFAFTILFNVPLRTLHHHSAFNLTTVFKSLAFIHFCKILLAAVADRVRVRNVLEL